MKEFKVGDEIRISSELQGMYNQGRFDIVPNMLKFANMKAKVLEIDGESEGYYLDVDGGDYYWQPELIEPLVKKIDASRYENIAKL